MKVKVTFICDLPAFQPETTVDQCIEAQVEEYLVDDDDRWLRLLDQVRLVVEVVEEDD